MTRKSTKPRKTVRKRRGDAPAPATTTPAGLVGKNEALTPQGNGEAADAILTRAALVTLNISVWTARKYDKQVTEETNRRHAASRDAGRYNKNLLGGDVESYKAVRTAAEAARRTHYENTAPWLDEGWRIIPIAHYAKWQEQMRAARQRYEDAVEEFVAEYPTIKAEAKRLLNGMYAESDYPADWAVRDKFGFDVGYTPVPAARDFRLDLPSDQMEEIERTVTVRVERAITEAMHDLWGRLHERVARIRDRLGDEKSPLRSNLIDDTRELLDTLASLNFTDDADLEAMRKRVERELTRLDVPSLKGNPKLRKETAEKAQDIINAMSAFYAPPAAREGA